MWTHQKLTPMNVEDKVVLCCWFLYQCQASSTFADIAWYYVEAHFHLNSRIISQNNRYWATTAPDHVEERPLHSLKCTAWCALSGSDIIYPRWFEDSDSHTLTVTDGRYRAVF